MRHLLFAALAALATAQAADVGPPIPFEDRGACPFEGCQYREWAARADVPIRTERRSDAPIVFRVRAGEKVQALTGVVLTTRAGRVTFSRPERLNTLREPITVVPGDTLYLLTYQGEGFTKAWFKGRLYTDVDCVSIAPMNAVCEFKPERCSGRVVERAQSEWWVQIRTRDGREGWTDRANDFSGKNAIFRDE